jgi:hypothetical protein
VREGREGMKKKKQDVHNERERAEVLADYQREN